jgi:hypothetical protein
LFAFAAPGYPAHMTGVNHDEPILLPVGHYMGPRHFDGTLQEYTVRGGWNTLSLNEDQVKLYFLGHGMPEQMQAGERNTRSSLAAYAASLGIADAAAVIDDLVRQGALVEVLPGTPQVRDFARAYRFCPLMLGLGNSTDKPGMWEIGLVGQPTIAVNASAWMIWGYGGMSNTLWEACEFWAGSNRRVDLPARELHDPGNVLDDFMTALPGLLATNAGYLDFPPTAPPA